MKLLKLPLFAEFLKEGSVFVFVLPAPELVLPPMPANTEYPLPLEYGYNMANPIPDLTWSERGIHATLSFNATAHKTFVPWRAVVAMRPQGQNAIVQWSWSLLPETAQLSVDATVSQPTPPPAASRPRLSIVRGDHG